MTTQQKIRPIEVEDFSKSTTDYVMNQNAGIGLVKLRQLLGATANDITELNKEVNEIMLSARKAISAKISQFIKERN